MRRRWFALLAIAVPIACGTFGETTEPAEQLEAGAPPDPGESGPIGETDAGADAGDAASIEGDLDAGTLVCDSFTRGTPELIVDGGIWQKPYGGTPAPKIAGGRVETKREADEAEPGRLQAWEVARADTVVVKGHVRVEEAKFGTRTGRLRLFDVDASVDLGAEFVGLEIDATHYVVHYRKFEESGASSSELLRGDIYDNADHELELRTRFHETAGQIQLLVDGRKVIDATGLRTAAITQKRTWQLRIGANPTDPAPAATVSFDDVCVAPFVR